MFGRDRDWESAEATIVARRLISKSHQDGYGATFETFEYVADVRPRSAAPFRATVGEPFNAIHFKQPRVGEVVPMKFRPKDRKVKFDTADPSLREPASVNKRDKLEVAAAHSADAQARWDAVAGGAPGSAATGRNSQDQSVDPATQRARVKAREAQRQYLIAHPEATLPEAVAKSGTARAQEDTRLRGEDQKLHLLERLAKLHAEGGLTDAEFAAEKAKLLSP